MGSRCSSLHWCDFPGDLPVFDREPREARWSALWAGDATGIQKANAFDRLVARYVCVAVQGDVACRRARRGNVLEMETNPVDLEFEREGPVGLLIAISAHDFDRCEPTERDDDRRVTDVAKMPDFVCVANALAELVRKAVVGVGDDCDFQGRGNLASERGTARCRTRPVVRASSEDPLGVLSSRCSARESCSESLPGFETQGARLVW
jgi:hypothetical protein